MKTSGDGESGTTESEQHTAVSPFDADDLSLAAVSEPGPAVIGGVHCATKGHSLFEYTVLHPLQASSKEHKLFSSWRRFEAASEP